MNGWRLMRGMSESISVEIIKDMKFCASKYWRTRTAEDNGPEQGRGRLRRTASA
jgi:hypothetical protein